MINTNENILIKYIFVMIHMMTPDDELLESDDETFLIANQSPNPEEYS